jgi:hypothetical protein
MALPVLQWHRISPLLRLCPIPKVSPYRLTLSESRTPGRVLRITFPAADDALTRVAPPVEWLESLFNDRPLPPGQGLFVFHGEAPTRFLVDHHVLRVQVMSGKSFRVNSDSLDIAAIIGLRMWVFGIEFRFFAANLDKGWSDKAGMSFRPGRLVGGRAGTQSLEVEWGQQVGPDDLQVLLSDSGIS